MNAVQGVHANIYVHHFGSEV